MQFVYLTAYCLLRVMDSRYLHKIQRRHFIPYSHQICKKWIKAHKEVNLKPNYLVYKKLQQA